MREIINKIRMSRRNPLPRDGRINTRSVSRRIKSSRENSQTQHDDENISNMNVSSDNMIEK